MPSDDNLDNDDQKAVLVKVSNMSSLKALSLIKQRLTEQQYEVFKETCFGHFVHLQDLKFAGQIVHALLLQYVRSTDKKAFSTAQSNDDTLMVKFVMLYFLESVLLGKEPKNKIDGLHIRLLDNFKEFNNYPWGRLSFEATMLSLKNTVTRRSKRIGPLDPNIEEKYSLYGFPYVFQVWTYEVLSEFGQKFATEKGDLKVPRILKWFCKNKIMADVINKALKEEDTFIVATTLHATGSGGSNEIAQHYMQWFLASEIEWKQELGELNAMSGDEPNNEPNSAHSNVQMQPQVDVVMDDRHATITDDISHTPFNLPQDFFLRHVTPSCRVSIGDHVAPTFQKIYGRLSKIEEKVQKIDVLEAKLDNITKDLWRTTKLLEEFLASFNAAKDSLTDQPPAHDPPTSVASHVDHDKIDDQPLAHDHQTAGTAHVDADKIDVEPSAQDHQTAGAAHVDADKIDVEPPVHGVINITNEISSKSHNKKRCKEQDCVPLEQHYLRKKRKKSVYDSTPYTDPYKKSRKDAVTESKDPINFDDWMRDGNMEPLVNSPSCAIMDTIYQQKLEHLYSVYMINPEKVWTNNATNYVVDYAKGEKLKCAVHWKDVSKVYIPLHPKQDHWALAQFDLQKEIIFVYDSMLDYMNDSSFEKELLPFVVMMPLILDRISCYTSHSDNNSLTRKWKAVRVSDIPQQKNNNDCGAFVMFYLEALVYGLDISYDVRTQAGINSYRKQVATRLFSDKKLIEECD
ncbi:hypothetical protein WN944_015730 [Citrus x changshan-huyou]|uniref:Ubiquitin-like protease family profile domain-containing protein n=1 Tax=Citrus x changshan-huyou TaxID=2935761 RepID=A0AAP0MAC6_9ROSI